MEKISTLSHLDNEASYTINEYIDFVAHDFPDGIIDPASDVFEKGWGSFSKLPHKGRVRTASVCCNVEFF